MSPKIVLVGLMGSGKSTVGRLVADRVGWSHVDTDSLIEAQEGCRVMELFARDGEAAFREIEARVAAEALDSEEPSVVSLGGGAVLDTGIRTKLLDHVVVWLHARPATLVRRLSTDEIATRPLLRGDALAALTRLLGEREPLYENVADVIIAGDGVSPSEAADRVLAAADERKITS